MPVFLNRATSKTNKCIQIHTLALNYLNKDFIGLSENAYTVTSIKPYLCLLYIYIYARMKSHTLKINLLKSCRKLKLQIRSSCVTQVWMPVLWPCANPLRSVHFFLTTFLSLSVPLRSHFWNS